MNILIIRLMPMTQHLCAPLSHEYADCPAHEIADMLLFHHFHYPLSAVQAHCVTVSAVQAKNWTGRKAFPLDTMQRND
jgi:hypothetical protein